jgi:hypothetical protein
LTPATALALAAAASMTSSPWLADLVLVVVVLSAALLLPPLVRHVLAYLAMRIHLARLQFPLALPEVSGYEISEAYTDRGTLEVELRQLVPAIGTSLP